MRLILDARHIVAGQHAVHAGARLLGEDMDQARQAAGADGDAQFFQCLAVQQWHGATGLWHRRHGAHAARLGVHRGVHGGQQSQLVDGLGEVAIHARFDAAFGVAGHGVCGHRDDRHAAMAAGQVADLPRGGVAVDQRHPHIHQHQVVLAGLHGGDGLRAIPREVDGVARLAQDGGGDQLVHLAILGQQDATMRKRQAGMRCLGAGCQA